MAQNDSGLVDEFDLDIRLRDGGSFGSLSEQFPTAPGAPFTYGRATCTYTCMGCIRTINCPTP
jgi:hypothetical protein